MRILSSAPGKVILFGEHYVVYGAPGLVAALGPVNEVEMRGGKAEGKKAGFDYHSTLKENNVSIDYSSSPAPTPIHPYSALYLKLAKELPVLQKLRVEAKVLRAWPLKGTGNSASLGAALGAGLRKMAGEKTIAPALLFEDAQTADEVAHGGRPSGIDAAAASYGGVLEFQKDFKHPPKPKIKALKISPMQDACFVLIDTFGVDGARGNTGTLISNFAKANAITKKPAAMTDKEREAVFEPYLPLFLQAKRALEEGDWEALGVLMDEEQKLLAKGGVSSPGIEKAIAICKSFGALGAKLSGAGGPGGVVIALVRKEKSRQMEEALKVGGFACYEFEIEKKGAQAGVKIE